MTALVLVETVLLAVLTVLVAGLLRAHGTVLRRLHALDGGTPPAVPTEFALTPLELPAQLPVVAAPTTATFGEAHDVVGESLEGGLATVRVTGVEHDTLLLFLSSGCSSCEVFWDELSRPGAIHLPRGTRLLVVPQGAEAESVSVLRDLAPAGVDVVLSTAAWQAYEVPGSPHVVYVDGRTGRVRGEGTGQSLRQVAELLARSTGDAGYVTGGAARKPARDAETEAAVDRELLAAGILPGDARLYESANEGCGQAGCENCDPEYAAAGERHG